MEFHYWDFKTFKIQCCGSKELLVILAIQLLFQLLSDLIMCDIYQDALKYVSNNLVTWNSIFYILYKSDHIAYWLYIFWFAHLFLTLEISHLPLNTMKEDISMMAISY